ncbi:MAG: UDP-N-acetylmuramate dehydrogenase [Bacteroidota bacterium]
MNVKENTILSPYTTIHLGGAARYFCECSSTDEITEALAFAASKNIRLHILSGGSNTIFLDEGFDGLIVKIDTKGISIVDDGDDVLVTAAAGEEWEKFTAFCVGKGYAGVECLSGIPGSVGATPIQNVGAYGQEVKDTIEKVAVLDRVSLDEKILTKAECRFSYRGSRFKYHEADRYVVTAVTFRLKKNGRPTINYPEVQKVIASHIDLSSLAGGTESLGAVRDIVLALRRKKSMVIDPNDPNTRSVGSFFMNPVVTNEQLTEINERWEKIRDGTAFPSYPSEGKVKVPAAWLIEKAGFKKGYTTNGVGISENHTLALVNRGGTTKALLALAEEIEREVKRVFSVDLHREANVVQ